MRNHWRREGGALRHGIQLMVLGFALYYFTGWWVMAKLMAAGGPIDDLRQALPLLPGRFVYIVRAMQLLSAVSFLFGMWFFVGALVAFVKRPGPRKSVREGGRGELNEPCTRPSDAADEPAAHGDSTNGGRHDASR